MDVPQDLAVGPRHRTGPGTWPGTWPGTGIDQRLRVRLAVRLTLCPLLGKGLADTLERHVHRRIPLWRYAPAERTLGSPALRPPFLETGLAEAVAARQEDGLLEDVLADRTAEGLLQS